MIIRLEMKNYNMILKAAKISALSSGKIDKYEYLTDEEILPSDQRQIMEQAKLAYSFLEKTLKKQTEKQVGVLKFQNRSNKKDE